MYFSLPVLISITLFILITIGIRASGFSLEAVYRVQEIPFLYTKHPPPDSTKKKSEKLDMTKIQEISEIPEHEQEGRTLSEIMALIRDHEDRIHRSQDKFSRIDEF